MPLLVCFACDKQREVFALFTDRRVCGNCGARHPISIRNQRTLGKKRSWIEWCDKDGIPKRDAYIRTFGGLAWFADQRKYKTKWTDLKFLKIFGFVPEADIIPVRNEAPTQGLLYWITRDTAEWVRHKRADEIAHQSYVERVDERISDLLPSFMTQDDWAVKL